MEQDLIEESIAPEPTQAVVAEPPPVTGRGVAAGLGIAALVAMVALQIFTLVGLNNANRQIDALTESMTGLPDSIDDFETRLGSRIDSVDERIDAVDSQMGDLDSAVASLGGVAAPADGGATAAPDSVQAAPVGTGSLPAFESSQNDLAVGLTLGSVSGTSYYDDGATVTYGPDDGVARVWMIWAHWCPFCQQEMPGLSTWWSDNAATLDNVELVSVTTSIDPSRGNPLEAYLDELQLPFPVIVDTDLSLARQFGTTAFPYWVFTDDTGVVVGRAAGLLDQGQIESIFGQLEALAGA